MPHVLTARDGRNHTVSDERDLFQLVAEYVGSDFRDWLEEWADDYKSELQDELDEARETAKETEKPPAAGFHERLRGSRTVDGSGRANGNVGSPESYGEDLGRYSK